MQVVNLFAIADKQSTFQLQRQALEMLTETVSISFDRD